MKSILTGILSLFIFFGTAPSVNAMDMNMAGMEEVKKKKKKGKKIGGSKGKKSKKGLEAKAYVKDLLENSDDGKFSIISHGTGKYGRVLGELFVKGHETSVNELLKENGHAYEYHGEKKKVFGS